MAREREPEGPHHSIHIGSLTTRPTRRALPRDRLLAIATVATVWWMISLLFGYRRRRR